MLGGGGRDLADKVLAETDGSGNPQQDYIYLNGVMIARSDVTHGHPRLDYYYMHDHLGTTRMITNPVGTVCYDADYFPYGMEQATPTNNCAQNYKFTGKERGPDLGIDDFGARWYLPTLARFLQPDWSGTPTAVPYADLTDPQTLNQYSYVRNNPLSRADADGHCPSTDHPCPPSPAGNKPAQNTTPPPPPTPGVDQKAWNESLNQYHPGGGTETTFVIAERVRHEANGMTDSKTENEPLSAAQEKIASSRSNAIEKFGNDVQKLASLASPTNGPGMEQALSATRQAVVDHLMGNDPTKGAFFFNMRTPGQAARGGPFQGQNMTTTSGPYLSPTPDKFIVTYGGNQ